MRLIKKTKKSDSEISIEDIALMDKISLYILLLVSPNPML